MKRKVQQLAKSLYEETKQRFPAIQFINVQEHPEQADRFWINVGGDLDEQEQESMRTFVGRKATDILIREGYSFAVMLDNTLLRTIH